MIPDCDGQTVGRSDGQNLSWLRELCIASYADALSKSMTHITSDNIT